MSRQPPPERDAVEQAFIAIKGEQGLNQPVDNKPVLFAEVLHYVKGTAPVDYVRVEEALGTDLGLRRLFNQLLAEHRLAFAPMEASADDGRDIDRRVSRGFSLAFRASRADATQIYVILELLPESGAIEGRGVSLLIEKDNRVRRINFPDIQDHATQTILLADDEILELLKHTDSQLSLIQA